MAADIQIPFGFIWRSYDRLANLTGQRITQARENVTMEHQDTLWVKVYDGEGDGAKLIFEGTAGEWEIFRNTHHWGVPKEIANQKPEDD